MTIEEIDMRMNEIENELKSLVKQKWAIENYQKRLRIEQRDLLAEIERQQAQNAREAQSMERNEK